jgi:glycosyltransferase involved in cell wall biosynthesis
VAKVSFIIPVCNAERVIGAALEAVLSVKNGNNEIEVVVVDNASTDRSAEIIKSFPVRCLDLEQRNKAKARNLGIKHAAGQWIATVDADVAITADWLNCVLTQAAECNLCAVQGRLLARESDSYSYVAQYRKLGYSLNQSLFATGASLPTIATGAALYSKQALESVGMFDEALGDYEDADLTWKFLACGYPMGVAEKAESYIDLRLTFREQLSRSFQLGLAHAQLLSKWDEFFLRCGITAPANDQWRVRLSKKPSRDLSPQKGWLSGVLSTSAYAAFRAGDFAAKLRPFKSHDLSSERFVQSLGLQTKSTKELSIEKEGKRLRLYRCYVPFVTEEKISLFNLAELKVISFSGVGRDFCKWALLQGLDKDTIVQKTLTKYDVRAEQVLKDLSDFVGHLEQHQVVTMA